MANPKRKTPPAGAEVLEALTSARHVDNLVERADRLIALERRRQETGQKQHLEMLGVLQELLMCARRTEENTRGLPAQLAALQAGSNGTGTGSNLNEERPE